MIRGDFMKKRLFVITVLLSGVLALAACGKSDNVATTSSGESTSSTSGVESSTDEGTADMVTMGISELNPDDYVVSLGDYSGMEIQATLSEVTDDDVENTIANLISAKSTTQAVEGRALQTGDIANINYEGKIDGEAFDGGTDDSEAGYDLTIGSGAFIPGFEDALIGMEVGETRDIDLVFPDEYYEELAGKAVVFTVKLNAIKETVSPELTDEFVAEQAVEGVTTVEELRSYVKEMLEAEAQSNYDSDIENYIMNNLIDICEYKEELPEGRKNYYYKSIYDKDEAAATDYGLMLEGYVMYIYGYSNLQDYTDALKSYSEKATKLDLAVLKILEAENQQITDEDVEKSITENYASYGCESEDDFKAQYDFDEYKTYLMNRKVIDLIREKATIVEAK